MTSRSTNASFLPLNSRQPPLRLTTANARGFRTYAPLHNSPTSPSSSNPEDLSKLPLTSRLRHLIKAYGWYAMGMYGFLGLVDFAIAFALINLLGADYVGQVTTTVKDYISQVLHGEKIEDPSKPLDMEPARGGNEGLYAMLILAYTVHKTLFFPFRAGLVVVLTPRFVRYLQTKGWAGVSGARRAATQMRERIKKADRE